MVEASCNRCGNSATGETFEEAEGKISCGLKLKGEGPCNENILERRCNGCPAYDVVRLTEEEGKRKIGMIIPKPKSQKPQKSKSETEDENRF